MNKINWNETYQALNVFYPSTIKELQQIVKQNKKIRVVGAMHSTCNHWTSENNISLEKISKMTLNDDNTITIKGGVTLKQASAFLDNY